MIINNNHLLYITNEVMVKFVRYEKIKVKDGRYCSDLLAESIDNYAKNSDKNRKKVINKIKEWLFQGRKKMLYRYFKDELEIAKYTEEEFIKYLRGKFTVHNVELMELDVLDDRITLINIEYMFGKSLEYLKFDFVVNVKQKNKDTDEFKTISLPVFVEVDFINGDIVGRVPSKSDIYTIDESKTEDVKVLEEILELVMEKLSIDTNISSVQKSVLEKAIYDIHREITELPEEIILRADSVNDEIDNFIEQIIDKLSLVDDENTKEELQNGIKNVLLKNIIVMYDDKKIFEEGKYAISTGINTSGKSRSLVQFNAPAHEPVQSNPEYQNIKNIIVDTHKIRKDVIFWNSVTSPGYKIRMKIYSHLKGYIQVCFEQYVYEEDIKNVLSKIREFV